MASIPILAAVAAAIIVPVAGTGIYYSVKPSSQEESTQQKLERTRETPAKSPQFPRSPSNGVMPSRPNWNQGFTDLSGTASSFIGGSARFDSGKLRMPEESLKQLKEKSDHEKTQAREFTEGLLQGRDLQELLGSNLPPSTTLRVEEARSVSSRSSLTRH